MNILLISTYELGRQPFGLASPAAWLSAAGHRVFCADSAVEPLRAEVIGEAELVGFHLPMHTATRLAVTVIQEVKRLNPAAHLCCYGLYAPLNNSFLRKLGVDSVIGGEFEAALCELAARISRREAVAEPEPLVSLDRLQFLAPDRSSLPPLERYAVLHVAGKRSRAGYTEASRGCKHLCRHCPVVPVYNGIFRIVQPEAVLEDVRRQVAAGADHITFGDPDFFNGPAHAQRIVEALHLEFPWLTYDVTIKIEHLLRHSSLLPVLRRTGCLFVTSAVESLEDDVLAKLDKGHTRADFIAVVRLFRQVGLNLAPTFIPFTPWTSADGYKVLLRLLAELDLVENVAPVQLALRLLVPAGSRLLELPDLRDCLGPFDEASLVYRWVHSDPSVDALAAAALRLVDGEQKRGRSRREIFGSLWKLAGDEPVPQDLYLLPRAAIPYMDEPWYC